MAVARSLTPEALDKHILALLPQDGTPVLNRVMRVMLCRELEQAVGPEPYFEARDRLFRANKIGRLRGQGGQVFLVSQPAFRLVVDGLSDAEAKSLAGRLDKNHPDIKAGTADWRRRHIVALASGADPAPKPQKPRAPGKKASAPARPKPKRALGSRAMAAVWDGKDRDD